MKTTLQAPDWNRTPRDLWERWQVQHLKSYLRHTILPFNPYYRQRLRDMDFDVRDLRSMEDWSQIPFTEKAHFMEANDGIKSFVIQPDQATVKKNPSLLIQAILRGKQSVIESIEEEYRPVLLTSTTGRSSDPVPFVYTKHDLHRLELAGKRTMEVGESTREYRHVNVFPFAPHLAFWFTHYAGLGFGAMMVGSGGGKTMGTQGNLTLIDRVNPDILIGMPTFLYHLCGQAVESGKKWTNLKLLVFGGEKTSQGLRARMVDLCEKLGSPNIRIMGTYGLTEAKMAFPQCPTSLDQGSSGYHLFPDMAIFEIIDPITGKVTGENEPGEIVITPLDARGTVVLRYRTGDIAEGGMSWERCPHCGRIGPKIMGPISRSSEIRSLNLDKVKGTLVDFNFLEHVLDNEKGIAAWQLEISKRHDDPHQVDELHLHLCLEPGMSQQDVEGRITERIYDQAEIRPNAVHFLNLIEMRDRLGVGKLLKEVKILDRRLKTPVATQRSTPTQTIQV